MIIYVGRVFLRYFPPLAAESNQREPPKRKGVQLLGFKIVFGKAIEWQNLI